MKKKLSLLFYLFLLVMLISYPAELFTAGQKGLLLWFQIVLPSLFPFLVLSSLLSSTGFLRLLGQLMNPLMEPIFHLPGISAFAVILGMISGYPSGSKITADMLQEGRLTDTQVQRLMILCNFPGPLFVLGTVSSGLLNQPTYGYLLLGSVWTAALVTGLLFRFYPEKQISRLSACSIHPQQSFYGVLNESIFQSFSVLVQAGGYIILFSVLSEIACQIGLFTKASYILMHLSHGNIPDTFFTGIFTGLLEMTNGIQMLSTADCTDYLKLPAIAFLLSFGGLSIFFQTTSFLSNSKFRLFDYFFSKIACACFAFAFCRIGFLLL
ncbi:MAG: hypothetical protein KHZ62_03410 [Clostridiales bacterium]|nr:hypothetical protein [Clostridiales bacterium]